MGARLSAACLCDGALPLAQHDWEVTSGISYLTSAVLPVPVPPLMRTDGAGNCCGPNRAANC